jgi:NADH:ubiquinone oxidoreductase subunit 4 (subunit M)
MFLLSCSLLEIMLLLDTLGLLFIWLSCWVFTIIFLSLYRDVNVNFFYLNSLGLLFVLTQLLFIAGDFLVYFVMFELTVIPLLVLLSLSSVSVRKTYAVFYMIFFVMVGTILFLCTWCYFIEYSLWLSWILMTSILLDGIDLLVITALSLLFVLVKIPSFPFYFWLPEAHVEVTIEGSVILAGIVLKLAAYGSIRLVSLFTASILEYVVLELVLIVNVGLVLVALSIFCQVDYKKIIAYSSVFHVNVALYVLFLRELSGSQFYIIFTISHGILSSVLFVLFGFFYVQSGNRNVRLSFLMWSHSPSIAAWWIFFLLFNTNFPWFMNFYAELGLFLLLAVICKWLVTFIAVLSLLCFSYSMILTLRFCFSSNLSNVNCRDIGGEYSAYFLTGLTFFVIMFLIAL